jgi:outer membrane protein assembly factor BamB
MSLKKTHFLIVVALFFATTFGTIAAEPAKSQWPHWRGPLANGVAPNSSPPLKWGESTNVRWKVGVPGEGFSTPIIWGDKVFLLSAVPTGEKSAAPPQKRQFSQAKVPPANEIYRFIVLCFDRQTGKLLWNAIAAEAVPNEGRHRTHTYASASPVTDGKRLYVSFGSHGIFCFNFNGRRIWKRDLGDMETRYSWGEGSSPVLADDKLIVNWDHEGPSFITALDKLTGKTLWKTDRDEVSSWATPLVARHNGKTQIVAPASGRIRGYDAEDGREIWSCAGLNVNVIPAPAQNEDIIYAMNSYGESSVLAIRLGSTGDITGTDAILWEYKKAAPYVPSPLLYDNRLYFLSGMDGLITTLDAETGRPRFECKRLRAIRGIYSSPVGANDRVYIAGRDGATVVLKHSRNFQILAINRLEDKFDASPAIVGKDLFLRSHRFLYCIAEPD